MPRLPMHQGGVWKSAVSTRKQPGGEEYIKHDGERVAIIEGLHALYTGIRMLFVAIVQNITTVYFDLEKTLAIFPETANM